MRRTHELGMSDSTKQRFPDVLTYSLVVEARRRRRRRGRRRVKWFTLQGTLPAAHV